MFEDRLRAVLRERAGQPTVRTVPAPCVVVLGDEARRGHSVAAPLDPRTRLLDAGAGHLDAVAQLDAVMARAMAAQARELAAFARCRPSSWDRQPGEKGAASAATRAARPAALTPVSEWAVAEVAARLRMSQRAAEARLEEAVVLVEQLPTTLAALEAAHISCGHARALVDLLQPVSVDKRAEVEAAALERAGAQTVDNLRARVRRLILRHDAAAALRRLVTAARNRKVALWADDDGMATLAASLPQPLARACHETLTAHARACAVDEHGHPDPRSLDERMADCFADLILRPHGDRPPVQIALTVVAGVGTLTGRGPGADEPAEVEGDLVPAPMVRELAATLGLPPRPATAGAQVPEPLERLLTAQRLTGTALAHRPHIALVDELSGTLLALTDAVELRQAAAAGRGLGPPPATEAYRPTDPLARFVTLRDRRCRFPGCRARARCADLDHQVPHPHGPTAHDNLACLCEHHHRLSHQAPGWPARPRRARRAGLDPARRTYGHHECTGARRRRRPDRGERAGTGRSRGASTTDQRDARSAPPLATQQPGRRPEHPLLTAAAAAACGTLLIEPADQWQRPSAA